VDVGSALPHRKGNRPATTSTLPHQQVDQQPDDPSLRDELARRAFGLDGVAEEPSGISVPGARALVFRDGREGPPSAFMVGSEFAHLHPGPDWSLHLTLPEELAAAAVDAAWAEPHPFVLTGQLPPTHVMVYAPRDRDELEVVWRLVDSSYRFAAGMANPKAAS
jgi:hypothetical protein